MPSQYGLDPNDRFDTSGHFTTSLSGPSTFQQQARAALNAPAGSIAARSDPNQYGTVASRNLPGQFGPQFAPQDAVAARSRIGVPATTQVPQVGLQPTADAFSSAILQSLFASPAQRRAGLGLNALGPYTTDPGLGDPNYGS